MPHDRRFRFGATLSSAASRREWIDKVRKAEDLGYSTIFMPDHLGDQLAPVPALMAAAEATGLKIGVFVMSNDYRHPVVVAKEAATLDLLSDGRLELGLGAGWMRSDYEESGIPFERPGVRIDRLAEAVAVIKGLLGRNRFTYEGEHYTVRAMNGRPKPVQQPHPPIIIGGGGERILKLAGGEADIIGINVNLRAGEVRFHEQGADAVTSAVAEKIDWVQAGAGERWSDIELNILIFQVFVTDDRESMAEAIAGGFDIPAEWILDSPHILAGTVDEICDDLERTRSDHHISYPVVGESGFEAMAPVVARLAGT